jgi:DNA-binding winged helix-turn-helix (wHTH) protein
MTYSFGPFQLDAQTRRLSRGDESVSIADRHVDVLLLLVSRAGQVVPKEALIGAAWHDVAVTDNSLEHAISTLRRTLGTRSEGETTFIETVARKGYRFAMPVEVTRGRQSDEALAAMLAPYRALVDGRAALETLDREAVGRAIITFDQMTREAPDYAPAHLGLANALALANESVRADSHRDPVALPRALHHASEACRLDPASGEAWATLSLLCHQSRDHERAIASAQRAAALEPDNWRHQLRLAYVSWGESRLRAAQRVLRLVPEFPLAYWLAATVHVAREAFERAEEALAAGAAAQDRQPPHGPFKSVGLHLLLGLVALARGDEQRALEELHRELQADPLRHIYGREACANAWCAIGAVHLRHGNHVLARDAFARATAAVADHVTAVAATAAVETDEQTAAIARLEARLAQLRAERNMVDAALAEAAFHTLRGDASRAAQIVSDAIEQHPGGSAGWSIPVDPFLRVLEQRHIWASALARVSGAAM